MWAAFRSVYFEPWWFLPLVPNCIFDGEFELQLSSNLQFGSVLLESLSLSIALYRTLWLNPLSSWRLEVWFFWFLNISILSIILVFFGEIGLVYSAWVVVRSAWILIIDTSGLSGLGHEFPFKHRRNTVTEEAEQWKELRKTRWISHKKIKKQEKQENGKTWNLTSLKLDFPWCT